ncbi:MAG: hypothetical protein KUG79_07470 [Pseudomonadales bacterium]|nr:hypothetical protein [Pseudomonadales bacterium]
MNNAMNNVLVVFFCSIVLCTLPLRAYSQQSTDEEIRAGIDSEFWASFSKCRGVDAVTNFNDKLEFWKVCNLGNGSRIIQIESFKHPWYFQEIYYERNGELVYTRETENYSPINKFTSLFWNVELYIDKGVIVSMMSLGHGKTERDDWDVGAIFDMFRKRKAELDQLRKAT